MKHWIALPLLVMAASSLAEAPPSYLAPADFTITTTVAATNPGGWTATAAGLPVENLMNCAEYEGFNFRSRLYAAGDGTNTIPLSWSDSTGYDCRREGYYDGATVRVYRIVSGKFVNVRRDVVARHRASGWWPAIDDKMVPPGSGRFTWNFDGYNSPVAPYYFAVVAVGRDGAWSRPSNAVKVSRPKDCSGKARNDKLIASPGKPATSGKTPASPAALQYSTAPDGVITFTWNDAADANVAGYVVLKSDYPPELHRGYGLDLAGKAASPAEFIRENDLVFLDLHRTAWSRNQYTANRVWGDWANGGMRQIYPGQQGESTNHSWTLVPHPGPIPPEFSESDRGRTCLQVTMTGGDKVELSEYNHAGPAQNWYPVLKVGRTYVVEFWARQQGMANPQIHFGLSSVYAGSIKQDFTLSSDWRKYSYEFTPDKEWPAENMVVGVMLLSFAGPGTLWLDCWRVYPKDTGYMQPPESIRVALRDSGMAYLRTHGFIKSGGSYFLDDLVAAPGVVASRGTVDAGAGVTLATVLQFLKEARVNPWLQVEMSLSEREWLGLAEYLAAPYDPAKDTPTAKPWAYRRYRMGQTRPWTDEFSHMLFEVSNETWNPMFTPWNFCWQKMTDAATGRVYAHGELTGLMTGYILDQMKKSPYWPALAPKLETVVGGWLCELGDNGFGQAACRVCPDIKHDLVANYNGGWDEGAAPSGADDTGRRLALTVVPQYIHGKNGELAGTRDRLAAQGTRFKVGTYEAGPGYALPNTITPGQVEAESQVMKSLAAGTGTLDCFLDGAQQGFGLQNFFTFGRGRNFWTSHAEMRRGGQAYPSWLGLTLYNNHAQGDFLVVQPRSLPVDRLDGTKTRKAMDAAPLTGVYATRNGDRYSVFVLSRKLDNFPYAGDDGFTPVTLRLPFKSARSITLYKMTGDPRATNLDAENVKIQAQAIPVKDFSPDFALNAARGADDRGLPPGATFLYVFEGTRTPSLPKQPRGTIQPAIGQAVTTSRPVVRFQALFDRTLAGLTADKIQVTGTAGGTARIEWPAEMGGTACLITVSDLEQSGDVSVEIPAGAMTDAAGAPNAVITSPVVRYVIPPPQDKILVQEGFDDVPSIESLRTREQGAGWKGTWMIHNLDAAKRPEGFAMTTQRPLAYPGLATTPGHLEAGAKYLSVWRWLDVDGALSFARMPAPPDQPAQVGLSGTTVWLSFLVRKERDDKAESLLALNAGWFWVETEAAVQLGYESWTSKPGPRVWGMRVRDGENKKWVTIPTTVPVVAGQTVLMVARVSFGRKDSVALYVNPPLTGAAPAQPSAQYTSENGRKLNFRSVVVWGGSPGSSAFDEIRLGDSFKAVTPAR